MDNLIMKYKTRMRLMVNAYKKHDMETHTKMRLIARIKMCESFIEDLENLKEKGESNE